VIRFADSKMPAVDERVLHGRTESTEEGALTG
jgi:hypothetical protein